MRLSEIAAGGSNRQDGSAEIRRSARGPLTDVARRENECVAVGRTLRGCAQGRCDAAEQQQTEANMWPRADRDWHNRLPWIGGRAGSARCGPAGAAADVPRAPGPGLDS